MVRWVVKTAQALRGVHTQAWVCGEERLDQLCAIDSKLPQPLFDLLKCGDGQQMNADFEWQADVIEIPADLAVEPAGGFELCRIDQVLRHAQKIFVRVRLDVGSRNLARIAHPRKTHFDADRRSSQVDACLLNLKAERLSTARAIHGREFLCLDKHRRLGLRSSWYGKETRLSRHRETS
jgi:hypothetical protein